MCELLSELLEDKRKKEYEVGLNYVNNISIKNQKYFFLLI